MVSLKILHSDRKNNGRKGDGKGKFGTHLKSQHHLTLTEYTKEHGLGMSHEVKHSCQVRDCQSNIWWDRQTIKSHVHGVHNKMSIEVKYFN